MVELSPVNGDQLKLLAPEAVSTTESPAQIEGFTGLILIARGEITAMSTVAALVLVHPFCVPETEYVAFDEGLALTVWPVVALNPEGGDQL